MRNSNLHFKTMVQLTDVSKERRVITYDKAMVYDVAYWHTCVFLWGIQKWLYGVFSCQVHYQRRKIYILRCLIYLEIMYVWDLIHKEFLTNNPNFVQNHIALKS